MIYEKDDIFNLVPCTHRLERGLLALCRYNEEGDSVPVAIYYPGDVFKVEDYGDSDYHALTEITLSDRIKVDSSEYIKSLEVQAERAREIAYIRSQPTPKALVLMLEMLLPVIGEPTEKEGIMRLGLNQEVFGSLVGSTRETISSNYGKLRRAAGIKGVRDRRGFLWKFGQTPA